jgi:peroxiredoxin
MKTSITLILVFFAAVSIFAQTGNTLPTIDLKNTDGTTISSDSIQNNGKPIIISFWATWCKPCVKELNTFAELYEEWQEETGVKLYAISVDDQRSFNNVAPFVNGRDWPFEVFCDPNGDFKRAMNVNQVPHTFIIDKDRNIVWQHTSFTEGGEIELIELIKKLNSGKSISE